MYALLISLAAMPYMSTPYIGMPRSQALHVTPYIGRTRSHASLICLPLILVYASHVSPYIGIPRSHALHVYALYIYA